MRGWRAKHEQFLWIDVPEIRVLCDESTHEIKGLLRRVQRPVRRREELRVNEVVRVGANSPSEHHHRVGLGQVLHPLRRIHPLQPPAEEPEKPDGDGHMSFIERFRATLAAILALFKKIIKLFTRR